VLAARILIVDRILGPAELAGAGLALIAWIVLSIGGGPRLRPTLITLLFGAFVIAERLAPFRLFATSWAETHLAGRSAKITCAVIALIAGGIIALVGTERRTTTPLSIAARLR